MRRAPLLVALLLGALPVRAHEVGVELLGNVTARSPVNPRAGAVGVAANGTVDFTDAWSAFASVTYLRDLPTRTAESASSGSNVVFLNLGAMFLPTEHFAVVAQVNGAPPSAQRNATTFTYSGGSADVVLRGDDASIGGSLVGSWASAGFSDWEHSVDLSAGANHFDSFQVAELGTGARARLFRAACERSPTAGYCPLVNGTHAALTQVRLGGTYTATLFARLDLALDVAGFLFDKDPNTLGSYSTVVAGRQLPELGLGVPVAPWAFTVRPSTLLRFAAVSLKVAYQLGRYTGDAGVNHLVSVRLTVKATRALRFSLTVLGQLDVDGGVSNLGGSANLSTTFVF